MREEQRKVRKLYKELQGWKLDVVGTWMGAGFLVLFMLIFGSIPAQEMLSLRASDESMLTWIMLGMCGPLAGFLYLLPYTTMTETVYTNSPKSVRIIDKLKYLPIDLKEIRKMKIVNLLKFYAKITPFCLLLQMLTSLFSYQEFTWKNILYVVVMTYVWPVVVNLPMVLMEKAETDSDNGVLSKCKGIVIVILCVCMVLGFLFFPRNLESMFLDGSQADTVKIMVRNITEEGLQEYELTGDAREQFLALLDKSYVRINPIQSSNITDHYIATYIYIEGNEEMFFVYSKDCVQMGDTQYLLYEDSFIEEFRAIFGNE